MFCEANDQLLVFFLSKIFLTKVPPSRRDVMFIEHENPKDLLATAERNGLAYHCRKHRAPLERRSCSQTVSINIWLRWSQNATWLRPKPRCEIRTGSASKRLSALDQVG